MIAMSGSIAQTAMSGRQGRANRMPVAHCAAMRMCMPAATTASIILLRADELASVSLFLWLLFVLGLLACLVVLIRLLLMRLTGLVGLVSLVGHITGRAANTA
ncbi:MAG: hypothetical protein E6J34_17555 [Chloroflexi bacterium]|jgi:hypothetical protein|nr:MAG: hypothetical protein E6J34_17555 [Chloroflexota bacterium]